MGVFSFLLVVMMIQIFLDILDVFFFDCVSSRIVGVDEDESFSQWLGNLEGGWGQVFCGLLGFWGQVSVLELRENGGFQKESFICYEDSYQVVW